MLGSLQAKIQTAHSAAQQQIWKFNRSLGKLPVQATQNMLLVVFEKWYVTNTIAAIN